MKRTLPTTLKMDNIEIIPDKVFFSIVSLPPKQAANVFYFSVDTRPDFQYLPFFSDFGPPSLLLLHRFHQLILKLMKTHQGKIIHYTCSSHPNHMANGVMFISSFRMIYLKMTAEDAFQPCQHLAVSLKPYRDASMLPCNYDLTVISCLKGLHLAMSLGWYNPKKFNAVDWEKYEQVEKGDMNWIIPGKLLAFATPYKSNRLQGGYRVATPDDVIPVFKKLGITHIVRLCEPFYNEQLFIKQGFKHTELYFLDGSTPPTNLREKFLKIVEGDDVVALHCKAGLGRTYVFLIFF